MSDELADAYIAALAGLSRKGPRPLHAVASTYADEDDLSDGGALLAHLLTAGPDDPLRQQLAHAMALWDYADTDAAWANSTTRNTVDRRAAICAALKLDQATTALFNDKFPYSAGEGTIVIAEDWRPWRTSEKAREHEFYWPHYERFLLEEKHWSPEAVVQLHEAAEEVIGRLADPVEAEAYQTKGLVVGYVQSGKTANFTGVIAKAVDAGYRLVIVLTGTTNMLRAQTQRRIDMELSGRENLEAEISPHDPAAHDYVMDEDWIHDRFLRHGIKPSDGGYPDIIRLSNHAGDFKALRQGFAALQFHKRERSRLLCDPVNLFSSDARLVVAKKNATVLQHLVADLGRIRDRLSEVPVLIIDDESDQASVNTTSPKKWKVDQKKRTAINGHIGKLLKMMPRAQYIGYTATPYANVFIDPADPSDIFPRNFIVALRRPGGYMGAEDFHDFGAELPSDEPPVRTSNERAHVRQLSDAADVDELRQALDMFVLTGAVKAHRQRLGAAFYRHHTMLVHEAMQRNVQRETAQTITGLWNSGDYYGPAGLARLRKLYISDVLPVSIARAEPGLPTPANFDDLVGDIAEAVRMISPVDRDSSPVIVVNSDKDLEQHQESLDFDQRPVWRILVGGNKLARGFTIEGLTVSYYRRSTTQVDTLMQMGRWFGFRPRYRDLVRLYTTADLHAMFEAACLDEEYLRGQLRQYATIGPDGRPQITPKQVPPLIAQHRPDLRPTSRTKMWNARITERRAPGRWVDPVAYPTDATNLNSNMEAWLSVIVAASAAPQSVFKVSPVKLPDGSVRDPGTTFRAGVAELGQQEMIEILTDLTWLTPDTFKPELAWLAGLGEHQLDRWVVLMPQHTGSASRRQIAGQGPFSVFERTRTGTGAFSVISESRHRNAGRRLTGILGAEVDPPYTISDPVADKLYEPKTAVALLYPVVNRHTLDGQEGAPIDTGRLTLGFSMLTPLSCASADGRLIKWETCSSDESEITVDISNPG
jgi:hypothetical protein